MTARGPASRPLVPLAGALVAVALAAGPARAQERPPAPVAEALFEEGRALMAAGRFADACPKLAESHRLDPGGGVVLNLAICLREQGRTASSWAAFKEALALARRDGRRDRAELAEQHLAALEPSLSRVTLRAARPVSAVRVDGRPFSLEGLGVATPFDPGPLRVDARWPDGSTSTWEIVVPSGRPLALELDPATATATAPPAPSPAPAPPAARPPPTLRSAGLVVGGVGLATLATGAVLGFATIQRVSQADDECAGGACSPRGDRLEEEAADLASAANVVVGVGLGVVAVGSVLFVVGSQDESPGARVSARWTWP